MQGKDEKEENIQGWEHFSLLSPRYILSKIYLGLTAANIQ